MSGHGRRATTLLLLILLAGAGRGADAEEGPATRRDLARALLAVERAFLADPPEGERLAAANREFDGATLAFFVGDGRAALARLDALARSLGGEPAAAPAPDRDDGVRYAPVRERLARLLDGAEVPPELVAARASTRARIDLLVDDPSPARSAEFLADRPALLRQVVTEVAAIRRGEDPWRRRPGRFWRVLPPSAGSVPFTLVAPPGVEDGRPRPLVVALHGAGGDENMFLRSYGAGQLADLAEREGFLVAAPLTPRTGAETFDALLATLGAEYAIDRDRVHVVGHSLGAGVAAILLRARPDRIASAALFSAGGFAPGKAEVPVLLVSGAIDRITPPARDGDAANVVRRVLPDQGHTLVVVSALPEAVAWLLARRRATER